MQEIWKDIKGYEGLYQVSNFGNVKSLERRVNSCNGGRNKKEKYIISTDNGNGYKIVGLSKKHKRKNVDGEWVELEDFELWTDEYFVK